MYKKHDNNNIDNTCTNNKIITSNRRILIIGLGNPGYDDTVHNVGSMFIQQQLKDLAAIKTKDYYYSIVLPNIFYNFNVSLMNISGNYIRNIIKNNNIKTLIVLYDDIRVPYGKYKLVFGGGHTGHNGIKSIMEQCSPILPDRDFYRVRIGVGPKPTFMELSDYVLSKVDKENKAILWSIYGKLWLDIFGLCKDLLKNV